MEDFELIIISDAHPIPDEAQIVNELFHEGLRTFHLRKPEAEKKQVKELLKKVKPDYIPNIVLHDHYDLGTSFKVKGLHTRDNGEKAPASLHSISRSVHSIRELYDNFSRYEYLLISPIYDSISKKGYNAAFNLKELALELENLKKEKNKSKFIALGGVDECNIQKTFSIGFDGAAVLGALWQLHNPKEIVDKFRRLKKLVN
jgi:thiamine-phosphate pyrophosphorylase